MDSLNMRQQRISKKWLVLLLSGPLLLTACVRARYFPGGGTVQTGLASWYGPDFHGRPTSNAEIYDMYELTAAHRSLPFGTQVMVTNLNNGRTVSVRINDRGPFKKDRIIDVSYAAARLLDMVGEGVVPVRLDVLKARPSASESAQRFVVQVGSFIHEENAKELERRLKKKYEDVYISLFQSASYRYYRVRIRAGDKASSRVLAEKLWQEGYKVLILEDASPF